MSKAKRNNDKTPKKEKLGKSIMYMPIGNIHQRCYFCEREFNREMIVEYNGYLYCDDDCIRMKLKLDETA